MIYTYNDWPNPPDNIHLRQNNIHIWGSSLDLSNKVMIKLIPFLSLNEIIRSVKFINSSVRRRWIVSRGILRVILSRYLNTNPSKISFTNNKYGKPFLTQEILLKPVNFNLSRSHELAIFAFCLENKIGIDIEYIRPDIVFNFENILESNESAQILNLSPNDQPRAFYNCWTRKEAFVKAKGQGLSIPLNQFQVSLLLNQEPRLISTKWDPNEVSAWSLKDILVDSKYICALAVEGHDWSMTFWKFQLSDL